MELTKKQGIEQHENCTMVIIPRYHKGKPKLIPGLYCEDHGCLIQWLDHKTKDALVQIGVEDLGPIKEEMALISKKKSQEFWRK